LVSTLQFHVQKSQLVRKYKLFVDIIIKKNGGKIVSHKKAIRSSSEDEKVHYLVDPDDKDAIDIVLKAGVRPISYHWIIESMVQNSVRSPKFYTF